MDVAAFFPYLSGALIPLSVGLAAILLYAKRRTRGLLVIAIGFFLFATPSIIRLALGGPYFFLRLIEQGMSPSEYGQILMFLQNVNIAIDVAAAIVVIVGLVYFAKENDTDVTRITAQARTQAEIRE